MFSKSHPHAGARPGTLLIRPDAHATRIHVVKFCADGVQQSDPQSIDDLEGITSTEHVTWIDVQGFSDVTFMQDLAEMFHIHPLAMEDIVNVPQRPKTEAYSDQLLIITHAIRRSGDGEWVLSQVGMILGSDYIITFSDEHTDIFSIVLHRIDCPKSRLRHHGVDYLAYALLDTVVDGFYPALECIGDRLERLEARVVHHPRPELLHETNAIKKQLTDLRRVIWPQRDAVQAVLTGITDHFSDHVLMFLRDTHDHCIQIADVVEMYREASTGLLNTYMSCVAHRSNEIMKVLTIMSSIFVPMTFVAGIYGMNFENMPELQYSWSYPMVWILMFSIAAGMLLGFRRMGWIGISRLNIPQTRLTASSDEDLTKSATLRVLDHDRRPSRQGSHRNKILQRHSA